MPLYDYRCTVCSREIEVMHPIGGSGPERCESCGGAMRKALSPPAIHFKGSGWAKKDAATSARKAATSAGSTKEGDKGKESDKGAAGKAEGAQAAKTDAASPGTDSKSTAGAGSTSA